jgi:hypothetical protein
MSGISIPAKTGQMAVVMLITACGGGGGGSSTPPPPPPANVAPTADINAPADLSVYVVGDSIQFSGTGTDNEDGALTGASLVWTSDIDGQVGTGTDFGSTTLSAGTHQVTVTVTDSSGASDSTTTLIRVSSDAIETYPSGDLVRASELYRVEVEIGGMWVDTNAYQYSRPSLDPSWHQNLSPWVHWTTIGVAAGVPVKVRVTRLNRPSGSDSFVSVELLPSRYNKAPVWDSDTVTFSIEQNQKVYVRTNDQDFDTLFVNAAPLKPPIPIGAKYFGPGIHNIGFDYALLPPEQDVYLDGGAWVIGSLHTTDVTGDMRIMGPGVLSGEFELWENINSLPGITHYMLIHNAEGGSSPTDNMSISGITMVGSPFWNVDIGNLNGAKYVDNVHILSPWTGNTDGFKLGGNGHITHTFVFNNDDTIDPQGITDGDFTVSNCVFAGRKSLSIGGSRIGSADPFHATISNVDLILQDSRAAFHGDVDGDGPDVLIDNQTYENITVDGDVRAAFYLAIEESPDDPGFVEGNVRNFTFTNVTIKGQQSQRSTIMGKDANNRIDNIVFNNFSIGGTVVTNANRDQFFNIDDATVSVDFNP